ncbi:MAG: NAD(+) synthase [Candidatus Asgardarchaeia archaeon]
MNCQAEIDHIAKWIKDYQKNSGCKGYICGISGGIDSAVCLALLKRKIPNKNIIAVALPCNSNESSLIDAQKLVDNLNIKLEIIDLRNSFNSIIDNLETINHKNEEISNLVRGNIAARLRMVQLYSIANLHNYLVLGTSNKSEILVGYGTKFGDLGIDIDPLGDYYKTEIYEIAKLMPEIPQSIIDKAPSADLFEGQKDQDDLYFDYPTLDKILQRWKTDCEKYINYNDGITKEDFEKVSLMIKKAGHKNNMPPMCPRS